MFFNAKRLLTVVCCLLSVDRCLSEKKPLKTITLSEAFYCLINYISSFERSRATLIFEQIFSAGISLLKSAFSRALRT